jgi:hypothetical protein
MNLSTLVRTVVACGLFWAGGCSLLVDVSDVDRGCGPGRKLCGTGNCVEQSDPAYGCSVDHCEPCALTNAIPDCSGATCVVKACLFGFGCPNEAGCAANLLVESENCGTCGVACSADASCRDGVCAPH